MGKHGNKREKLSERTSPKGGHQHPRRRSSFRYYGMWSLSIIVIVAAAAVAWSVFKDDSPSSTAADPASNLLNASLPTKADSKLVEPIPESVSAVARLEIPEPEFDFGFVPQNSKVSHVFWLHSAGTDTLKIVKVNPGWGCTQAPLEKDALAVGDSTTLEIIFSTGSFTNQVTKSPTIMTNEGQGVKNVRIKANIVSRPDSTYPVVIHPMKIEFAETDSLEILEFTIINKTIESITPSVVSVPNRLVSVSLPPWIAAADSAKGSIKLKKAGRGKSFEKSLTIQLNDDAKSRFTIPIERVGIGQEAVVPTHGH